MGKPMTEWNNRNKGMCSDKDLLQSKTSELNNSSNEILLKSSQLQKRLLILEGDLQFEKQFRVL